jgi:hypothetical protein
MPLEVVGQLRQKAAGPHDLPLGASPGQQLVHELVRQLAAYLVRQPLKDLRWGRRRLAHGLGAARLTTRTNSLYLVVCLRLKA